jgi:K+-sensing histidine kinase KdpD
VSVALKYLAGIAVCGVTALMLTFFLRGGGSIRLAAPVLCLQVVIVAALYLGRVPALIGAVIAGLTFALWLYPPYGHLWIHDPAERVVLTLFQLTALGVTQILPRTKLRSGEAPRAPLVTPGHPNPK